MNKKTYFIHESSYVDEGAKIGRGTKIWHFSHIMSGAVIGENCSIGQSCTVENRAVLGNRVKVQNNISVYGMVEIADDVFLGPSMVFTNDINPRAPFPKKGNWMPTKVMQGASIGANATILCGITIGKWALVGAGAVVTKDIPDYAVVMGNPARVSGYVCKCGKKMEGIDHNHTQSEYHCECGRKYSINDNGVTCNEDKNA